MLTHWVQGFLIETRSLAGSALRKIEKLHADPAHRNEVSSPMPRLTSHAEGDQIHMP